MKTILFLVTVLFFTCPATAQVPVMNKVFSDTTIIGATSSSVYADAVTNGVSGSTLIFLEEDAELQLRIDITDAFGVPSTYDCQEWEVIVKLPSFQLGEILSIQDQSGLGELTITETSFGEFSITSPIGFATECSTLFTAVLDNDVESFFAMLPWGQKDISVQLTKLIDPVTGLNRAEIAGLIPPLGLEAPTELYAGAFGTNVVQRTQCEAQAKNIPGVGGSCPPNTVLCFDKDGIGGCFTPDLCGNQFDCDGDGFASSADLICIGRVQGFNSGIRVNCGNATWSRFGPTPEF